MTRTLICFAFVLLTLNLASIAEPQQQLPLVKADYQRCVTIQTAPLEQQRGLPLYPGRKDVA